MQSKRLALRIRASLLSLSRPKIRPRQPWPSRSRLQSPRWPLRQQSPRAGQRPPQPLSHASRLHRHRPGTPRPRRIAGTASRPAKPVETGQRTLATDTEVDFSSPTDPDGRHGAPLVARNSPLIHGKRHESSRSLSPSVFLPEPVGAHGPGARLSRRDEAFLVCFRYDDSRHHHAASAGDDDRGSFAVTV